MRGKETRLSLKRSSIAPRTQALLGLIVRESESTSVVCVKRRIVQDLGKLGASYRREEEMESFLSVILASMI